MARRRRRMKREMADVAGAEKKLRQAKFFLGYLEYASRMVYQRGDPEHLEFFFSACLTAAQSIYYVLQKTGGATSGKFKSVGVGNFANQSGHGLEG